MEAQFEALSELVKNGQKLNFGQDFFVKFYQAFLYSDRWQQYIKGCLLYTSPSPRDRG